MKHLEKLPLGILTVYTTKLLILQNWNFPDAIVLVALATLTGLFQLKAKSDEIKELKDILAIHAVDIQKLQKQDEHLQTSVTSMKYAASIKPQVKTF